MIIAMAQCWSTSETLHITLNVVTFYAPHHTSRVHASKTTWRWTMFDARAEGLTAPRPDGATIGPSLLFWRVGARSGFCPISESTMDLASRFASLAAWR
jgi:hypothetical protein